jgi:hypothetical protein
VQFTVAYAALIVGVLLYVGAVRRGLARPAEQPSVRRGPPRPGPDYT